LPASAQIWLVANGWHPLPEGSNLSNMTRLFQSIESATATVDLRSGITAVAQGECRTEQDAKSLAEAIRGMVALGRLSVPEKQPEMLRLYDGIKAEQKQRSIHLNVQIPADLVDRLPTLNTR